MKEKTKNKRVSRLLAFGLALAMFQPLGIRAEDTPTRIPEPFTNSEVAASTAEEPEIGNEVTADFVAVAEAEDRRGMYERHFLCEDGSYVAIHYGYPVNYPNEEGEWQEIDNTLTTVSDDEGNQVVENKDGLFDVRFSVDGEGEELVSMEQDGHILSWNVTAITDVDTILDSLEKEEIDTETAARVFGKAEKKAEKEAQKAAKEEEKAEKKAEKEAAKEAKKAEREEQKAALGLKDAKHGKVNAPGQIRKKDTSAMTKTERLTSAHKAGSAIVYEEAFGMENVDVAYEISPTAVKENIILNSVSEITSYEVEMTAGGMTATLEEDGSITFADEAGEMAFEVAAPVMYDAVGEESYDIAVTLTDNGNGTYTVVYTPSVQWLLDAARVYPVNVDPSVYSARIGGDTGRGGFTDTFATKGKTGDFSRNPTLFLANGSEAYFKINPTAFPSIPKGSVITDAAINLFVEPGTTGSTLTMYQVTGSWNPTTVTYNGPASTRVASFSLKTNAAKTKYYSIPALTLLKTAYENYWLTGVATTGSYSFKLMHPVVGATILCSSEYSDATYRPTLWFKYKNPQLSVKQYYQQSGWTCGPACSVMMLQYLGVDVETKLDDRLEELKIKGATEYPLDIKFYLAAGKTISVEEKEDGTKKYSHVSRVMSATEYQTNINRYLNGNTSSSNPYPYSYHGKGTYISQSNFVDTIRLSLEQGYPVMVLIRVYPKDYEEFGYNWYVSPADKNKSISHYILVTGITEENGVKKIIYNDPHQYFEKTNTGRDRIIDASILYSHMKNYEFCAFEKA